MSGARGQGIDQGAARDLCRENVAALRAMLGEEQAIPAIEAAVALGERHQDADELALMAEVFLLGSLIVGEEEARAARWVSLRLLPHRAQGEQ